MAVRLKKIQKTEKSFEEKLKEHLTEKLQEDDEFAKHLYASLCNTNWFNKKSNDVYSCSWRYAGGIVAELRNKGEDYLNFYCSGGEGGYFKDVHKELNKIGYKTFETPKFEHLQEFEFK